MKNRIDSCLKINCQGYTQKRLLKLNVNLETEAFCSLKISDYGGIMAINNNVTTLQAYLIIKLCILIKCIADMT